MSKEELIKQNSFAAGIVLFNPDFSRLRNNIENLTKQIKTIIFYNNGAEIREIGNWNLDRDINVIIIGDGTNRGIARALNGIMEKANEFGFEWVLTLDQDSIVPSNLISSFKKVMVLDDVAIICPQNIDFRRKYMGIVTEPESETVQMCDTSGSCTRLSAWKEIGKFDDWLFIDLVDNDFCKRINLKGYRIVRINSVIMDHQYGDLEFRGAFAEKFFIKLGKMLHSTNIQKLSFKRKVNPIRVYYENRNVLYLNKKYAKYGGIGYANHHCRSYAVFLVTFSAYSWLVSDKKRETFRAIIKGIKDGKAARTEAWTI